jgi:hypothetical protein
MGYREDEMDSELEKRSELLWEMCEHETYDGNED